MSMWEYNIGCVVLCRQAISPEKSRDHWGHVVGFAQNVSGEHVLEVKWSDGTTRPIHPFNVETACPHHKQKGGQP